MQLLMLGLNHKTAPVEVRERFSLAKAAVRQGLMNMSEYEGIQEMVVLSTCNRSEIYAVVDDASADEATLKQFLFDLTGNEENIDAYLYKFVDEECIRHLFLVASSLDSLVLGEGQILSQVKEAYALSREAGTTSTVINTLFHRAIATGKRVRTETRIAYNSVSVSYAAVELARQELGNLNGASALIFGAGKMAELTAQHLVARGVEKILVANRHLDKAEVLAKEFAGEAVPWNQAMKRAVDVDVIVTSTGAPHYVIKPWETQQLMAKRKGHPLFFIDIAVPRDVDPEVADIKGVTLYNIDSLEAVVDEHVAERRQEAKAALKIVEEEVEAIEKRFQYLSFQPLMAHLSNRCERIRAREVRRSASKLPDLSEAQWRQVEHMSHMIVRKILRMPMMKLAAAAGTEQEEFYLEAMRALFKLDTIGETKSEEKDSYRYAQQ